MSTPRRPLLIGALTAAIVALVASAAVAVGAIGGPSSGPFGMRGGMGLSADHATVPHGTVSFLVTNGGSIDHEMVILPLAGSQAPGARPIGGEARIDEAGSLGEASTTHGPGAGNGITPGASGWVTVTLAPGHYELVCNLPRHYAAGMYTQLNVI